MDSFSTGSEILPSGPVIFFPGSSSLFSFSISLSQVWMCGVRKEPLLTIHALRGRFQITTVRFGGLRISIIGPVWLHVPRLQVILQIHGYTSSRRYRVSFESCTGNSTSTRWFRFLGIMSALPR